MKGVILAGGKGTRLAPLTNVANKHLLPVYDKPMILYPLATLKCMGITEIMIVTGGEYIGRFAELLGDGSEHGVELTYRVQEEANGIAGALLLARDFVGDDEVMVILGDNIFDNREMKLVPDLIKDKKGDAVLFLSKVPDANRFGVPEFDDDSNIVRIEEKPIKPKSDRAVTGLYKYPPEVFGIIEKLKPSDRGELEITDVNNAFIESGNLDWICFGGFWKDTGTHDSLLDCANWIRDNNSI